MCFQYEEAEFELSKLDLATNLKDQLDHLAEEISRKVALYTC